jgi:starch-binding outer membrane protein, SusD/RagB family
MKKYSFLLITTVVLLSGCKKDWLDRQSKTLIVDNQVWNDPKEILALIANYYDRLPTDMGLRDITLNSPYGGQVQEQWRNMADYDDAMWSGYSGEDGRNNITSYPTSRWSLWDYGLIRDINMAIENIGKYSTSLTEVQKAQFVSELRFQRAFEYFQMVIRMGGVPLVTSQLIYDYSGNPSPLQQPRAKESEVYDFIASEMDAIKDVLGNAGSNTRANKYTALALKSRAMLYAGSLAKYNSQMASPITTPGGEVGIPASRATEYYTKSLEASLDIINNSPFSLYKNNANPGENFYEAITKKLNNKEVIFARDFLSAKNKRHAFSYDNIVRSIREDNLGSSAVTPSLNLVESYDYLDGSNGALKTMNAANTDYIYYDNLTDIFANKDARLYGTVIYPGASFKGITIPMQAGVMVWNATTNAYTTIEGADLGTTYTDGKMLVSAAGPHRSIQEVSNTGFYLRKFIDAGAGTSTRGILSDVWWIYFRMGEIYLNAAEAAFELGQTNVALTNINKLRERAGFPANSLTSATLTMAKIRNERRNELAFEDHRVWDLKRWRIADQVWNGNRSNPDAMVYALYPYRVIRPGDPARDGKYVFVKMIAPRFIAPRFFQVQNYYTFINQSVIDNNPKIVRNPFQ